MREITWLLAGAGDIAKSRVAAALGAAAGSRLLAICDPVRDKAEALASAVGGAAVYADYDQALRESGAEAVYLATPHHLHVDMCLRALAANKHFLCEKPLGINGAECRRLLDATRRSDRVCCCSNYRLFTNQFQTTLRLAREDALGDCLGGWVHDEESDYNPGHTPCLNALGRSPVLGLGFYPINMVQTLLGTPSSVFAAMTCFNVTRQDNYDIADLQNIILMYPDGRQFSIILNTTVKASLRHACQFYFSRGRLYWPECPPHFNSPIVKITGMRQEVLEESFSGDKPGQRPNWHLPMVNDFLDAIRQGRQPRCTIASATQTACITDALFAAAAAGHPEPVQQVT